MNFEITSGKYCKDHIFVLKEKGGKFVFNKPEQKAEADKTYIHRR